MFKLTISVGEQWDESKEEFIPAKEQTLQLEHSLVSLSKWEAKWHKPFLETLEMTREESLDYIKCMTITQNVDPDIYKYIGPTELAEVRKYIDDPMTATTFSKQQNAKRNKRIITAELIYYWMIAQNIPMECQKWHLNRLMTLIRVCSAENEPPTKKSKREIANDYAALNAERRRRLQSKG